MAYIEPSGKMWICKNIPLNHSYEDTMTWTSLQQQVNYFMGKTKWSSVKYTPIKERQGVLRVNGAVNKYYDCNYLVFLNDNFYNPEDIFTMDQYNNVAPKKYFFAFITNVEYLNPETTLIYFEIDVMQTWFFEIKWERSLIEREHVRDDSLYANLEPENIQVNERIPYSKDFNTSTYLGNRVLVIGFTENPENIEGETGGSVLGNIKVPYSPYVQYPNIEQIDALNVNQFYKVYDIGLTGGSNLGNASYAVPGKHFWVDASIDSFTFYLDYELSIPGAPNDTQKTSYYITATKTEGVWSFTGYEIKIDSTKEEVKYNFTMDAPEVDFGILENYDLKAYIEPINETIDWKPNYVFGVPSPAITFYVPNNIDEFIIELKVNFLGMEQSNNKVLAYKTNNKWSFINYSEVS